MPDGINGGRESFERRAWDDSYAQLSAADGDTQLGLEDLERLAVAAYLSGRDEVSVEVSFRSPKYVRDVIDPVRIAKGEAPLLNDFDRSWLAAHPG